MKVLGIESSCDETAASVVEDGKNIMSSVVATQIPFHKEFSGVVPEIASRKHAEWMLPVVKKALKDANLSLEQIDAVAATNRPGLMGCLLVGLTFAKTLAWSIQKPFIAINHILGHLYAVHLSNEGALLSYPFLGLLVSGGHSIICKALDFDKIDILGTTVDDSVGEAFDKVAKFYSLGYPGGIIIDKLSQQGKKNAFKFPIAKVEGQDHKYDVSFSGLKTAVIHQKDLFLQPGSKDNIPNLCASFQEAACKTLFLKLQKAAKDTGLNTVVAGGGVAANSRLRQMLQEQKDLHCIFPPLKLCGDNAAMIAGVAYHFLKRGDTSPLDTLAYPRIPQFKHSKPQATRLSV